MACHTILYARRSTDEDDRQTLSLDAQEKESRDYASRQDFAVTSVIRESHSARKPGRPLFNAMLLQAKDLRAAGHEVRILCHKPDRLLRNIGDWAKVNDLMDVGVELLFVTGSYPNNAQGKMAFGINVLFAKYYVDNLSEEVKKGLREKISRGEWPARAPLGYRNVTDKAAPERVVLDPVTAPLVRRAFEYYATGDYSFEQISRKLHDEGLVGKLRGNRLSKGYVQERILTNPFYCGLLRYGGRLYPGVHPPLVSVELFERVQQAMARTGRTRQSRHEFRYAGVLRCLHCGCAVVADVKKGKYVYYRCNRRPGGCGERYVRQEQLNELVRASVREAVFLGPGVQEALRSAAERLAGSRAAEAESRAAVEKQAREAERKSQALLDLRLGGHLSDEEFSAKRAELALAQARCRERLATLERTQIEPSDVVEWLVGACNSTDAVFQFGRDAEVRQFLNIVGSNYRLGCGKVHFEPVEPFTMAARARNRPLWSGLEDDVRNFLPLVQALMHGSRLLPADD